MSSTVRSEGASQGGHVCSAQGPRATLAPRTTPSHAKLSSQARAPLPTTVCRWSVRRSGAHSYPSVLPHPIPPQSRHP